MKQWIQHNMRWIVLMVILVSLVTGCAGEGIEPTPMTVSTATPAPAATQPPVPTPSPSPVATETLVPAPVREAEAHEHVLYEDNFEDYTSGWPDELAFDNYYIGYHEPDWYHVDVHETSDRAVVVLPDRSFDDFTVETTVFADEANTSKSGDFRQGLALRRSGTRFYAFALSPQTQVWYVLKSTPTGLEVLDEGTDDSIHGIGDPDVLRVDAQGSALIFHINGKPVSQISDMDYVSGGLGFFVETFDSPRAHVHFDLLTIREAPKEIPTLSLPISEAATPTPAAPTPTTQPTATPRPPTATPMPPTPTETPTRTPTHTLTPTSTPQPRCVVTASSLNLRNLRAGPGTVYSIVGRLQKYDRLTIVARNSASDWLEVETTDGHVGWVFGELVDCTVPISSIPVETDIPPTPTFTPVPSARSLQLNGTDAYVSIPYYPELNTLDAITIEAWVKRAERRRCETVVGNGWRQSYWLGFCSDTIRFYHGSRSRVDGNTTIPAGEWTHIAVTYDGQTRRYYVNGDLDLDTTDNAGPLQPADNLSLYIGADRHGESPFQGLIDEVRVWNVVRSQAEIQNGLHQAIDSPQPGLVAVWHFDGTADDAVGGHHGTLTGDATYSAQGFPAGP